MPCALRTCPGRFESASGFRPGPQRWSWSREPPRVFLQGLLSRRVQIPSSYRRMSLRQIWRRIGSPSCSRPLRVSTYACAVAMCRRERRSLTLVACFNPRILPWRHPRVRRSLMSISGSKSPYYRPGTSWLHREKRLRTGRSTTATASSLPARYRHWAVSLSS